MRWIGMLMLSLAAACQAQAADKPEFTFDGKVFKSTKHPAEFVEIGEAISLLELGRRFGSYEVSADYFIEGDSGDEYIRYFVKHDDIEFQMWVQDDEVMRGFAHTPGIAGPNGAQVGDSVSQALGEIAYCDFGLEDTPPFCKGKEDAPLAYRVAFDEKCSLEEGRRGEMPIPACRRISALATWY